RRYGRGSGAQPVQRARARRPPEGPRRPERGLHRPDAAEGAGRQRADAVLAGSEGKTGELQCRGSPVDYALRLTFQKQGLSLAEGGVQGVTNTARAAALARGAGAAGVVPEPIPVLIESQGIGSRFVEIQEIVGPQTGSVLTVGPSVIGRGDATITRFL